MIRRCVRDRLSRAAHDFGLLGIIIAKRCMSSRLRRMAGFLANRYATKHGRKAPYALAKLLLRISEMQDIALGEARGHSDKYACTTEPIRLMMTSRSSATTSG